MQSTDPSYSVPPFPAFPSTSRYIPLGSVQAALGRVCRSIDAREAVSLVIGPPGTGKSLICSLLVEHYRASHEVVVLGETPLENRAAFLRHLLHHLGADFTTIPDGDLQLALIDRVCGDDAPEGGLLIVVDEAQSLSTDVIESIRMATNIMRDGEPRVFAVLCGGVKLDETLVETCLESFTQRVATRCYLHPMNGDETRRYVNETIRNCGAEPESTITDDAISAVHHACCGVPRLINQMLTQAIDCAEEADQAQIDGNMIDRAWAQLQQLPSPMVEEPKMVGNGSAVEFGSLDETIDFGEWTPAKKTSLVETSDSQAASVAETANQESLACESDECNMDDCEPGNCDDEISVEGSNAQWVEEPVAGEIAAEVTAPEQVTVPTIPSPAELFGEFESEEEVVVGNGVSMSKSSATPVAPPTDLEAMLHQELIGINSFAGEDSFVNEDSIAAHESNESEETIELSPIMHDDNETVEVEEPEERVEEFVTVADDEMDCETEEKANPVLWISEEADDDATYADADDAAADDDSQMDDSDILVIEDELELRRLDSKARVDGRDQTISVDFQAMLTKMRSGS